MTRGKRRQKVNKPPRLPTIVPASTEMVERTSLSPDVARLQTDITVLSSRELFIAAPVKPCFELIAKQLDMPSQWDPIIVNAWPVSDIRRRIGATSQVVLNLGGRKLGSLAIICRYQSKRAIGWVLSEKPKVREDWRLEAKPSGTRASVTLAYEVPGWIIRRLLYKKTVWKKVERDLDQMLTQLKAAVENGST